VLLHVVVVVLFVLFGFVLLIIIISVIIRTEVQFDFVLAVASKRSNHIFNIVVVLVTIDDLAAAVVLLVGVCGWDSGGGAPILLLP
jgi:hypothetical protein